MKEIITFAPALTFLTVTNTILTLILYYTFRLTKMVNAYGYECLD